MFKMKESKKVSANYGNVSFTRDGKGNVTFILKKPGIEEWCNAAICFATMLATEGLGEIKKERLFNEKKALIKKIESHSDDDDSKKISLTPVEEKVKEGPKIKGKTKNLNLDNDVFIELPFWFAIKAMSKILEFYEPEKLIAFNALINITMALYDGTRDDGEEEVADDDPDLC